MVELEKPCKLWHGATNNAGYGVSRVDKVLRTVHRREYEKHHGPIPEGLIVRHKCDVRRCYEITHLELGTPADNTHDMLERGRARPSGHALRPQEEQSDILRLLSTGLMSQSEIAALVGCSQTYVSLVKRGKHRRLP